MSACCDGGRKILSVENSYYLDTASTLTTTPASQMYVDLDLRSGSSWHLNASAVAVLLMNSTANSTAATLTLRVSRVAQDGSLRDTINLTTGRTTIATSTTQTVTLARSVHLSSGYYRIQLMGSQDSVTSVTTGALQPETTASEVVYPASVISAQATREAIYL